MKYKLNNKKQIEKSDFSVLYNKDDFQSALDKGENKIEELIATKRIYDAKADNVARNHPEVLKLDEDARNKIWLYQDNFIKSKQTEQVIKLNKKALKDLVSEMKDIEKQTGIKFN